MTPINLDLLEKVVCGPAKKTPEETLTEVEKKLANIEQAVQEFNKKKEPEPDEPGNPPDDGPDDDGSGTPGKD